MPKQLVLKAVKNVISNCPTHWNSTYDMVQRMIEIKEPLNKALGELQWDGISNSEWRLNWKCLLIC